MRGQLTEAERFALCDCEGGDLASDECSNRIALVERIVQRHIEAALAERLQAAEVGACGAAVGEAGTELPARDSGAQSGADECPPINWDAITQPWYAHDLEITLKNGEVLRYVPKEALTAIEAERDRLAGILARVKALAKEWKRLGKTSDYYGRAWYPAMARELRAALSDQEIA